MTSRRLLAVVLALMGSLAVWATQPRADAPAPPRSAAEAAQAPAPAAVPEPEATPRLDGIRDPREVYFTADHYRTFVRVR